MSVITGRHSGRRRAALRVIGLDRPLELGADDAAPDGDRGEPARPCSRRAPPARARRSTEAISSPCMCAASPVSAKPGEAADALGAPDAGHRARIVAPLRSVGSSAGSARDVRLDDLDVCLVHRARSWQDRRRRAGRDRRGRGARPSRSRRSGSRRGSRPTTAGPGPGLVVEVREQQPVDAERLRGGADEGVDACRQQHAGEHEVRLVHLERPQEHRRGAPSRPRRRRRRPACR